MSDRDLLPLDAVVTRLGGLQRHYRGVETIPVDRIIGTLDRSTEDFDRRFTARRGDLGRRLASLRRRYPQGDFPPIQVVELGGAYFVIDGHHRVALAHALGMQFVDAEITAIEVPYEVPPDVDVRALVHTDQRRRFDEATGLSRSRSDADIRFSRAQGYPELLEVIHSWAHERSLEEGRLLSMTGAAQRWYDEVFAPAVASINRAGLPAAYSYKTDADLFLWIHQLRRAMLVDRTEATFDDAARQARGQRKSRRFKRSFLRQRSIPLSRRRATDNEAHTRRS